MTNIARDAMNVYSSEGVSELIKRVRRYLERESIGRIRLWNARRRNNDYAIRKIHGNKMYLPLDDPGISTELLARGTREELATEVFRNEMGIGETHIDIGANIGYYVLMAADLVGSNGKVHAIEPVPRNIRILRKNIKLNNCSNVDVHDKAISSKNGVESMTITEQSNHGTLHDDKSAPRANLNSKKEKEIEIQTQTFDSFIEEQKINSVDSIRMDVEGYETEVFKGMSRTLSKVDSPCRIFVEVHTRFFEDPEYEINEMLRPAMNCGFEITKFLTNDHGRVIESVQLSEIPGLIEHHQFPHLVLKK